MAQKPSFEKYSENGDTERGFVCTIPADFGEDASELLNVFLEVYGEASQEYSSERGSPISSLGKPRAEILSERADFGHAELGSGSLIYADVRTYFSEAGLVLEVAVDGQMIGSRGSPMRNSTPVRLASGSVSDRSIPESYGRSKPSYESFDDALYLVGKEAVSNYCKMHIGETGG